MSGFVSIGGSAARTREQKGWPLGWIPYCLPWLGGRGCARRGEWQQAILYGKVWSSRNRNDQRHSSPQVMSQRHRSRRKKYWPEGDRHSGCGLVAENRVGTMKQRCPWRGSLYEVCSPGDGGRATECAVDAKAANGALRQYCKGARSVEVDDSLRPKSEAPSRGETQRLKIDRKTASRNLLRHIRKNQSVGYWSPGEARSVVEEIRFGVEKHLVLR